MAIPNWIFFLIAITLILYLTATKIVDLWVAIFVSALFFALFSRIDIVLSFKQTFFNASNLFLCLAVSIIPILGGVMKESGMMIQLVRNLDVSKKSKFQIYPALLGLLPIPGGALFSAPLVDEIDKKMSVDRKVAINVWYRHLLILFYPLSSSIIIASRESKIPFWTLVSSLMIPLVIMFAIGHFSLLNITLEEEKHKSNVPQFILYLMPIILSPIIAGVGEAFLPDTMDEDTVDTYRNLFFLIGIFLGLILGIHLAPTIGFKEGNGDNGSEKYIMVFSKKIKQIPRIAKTIKFWRFPLLIYAMLYFLNVFKLSDVPEFIGSLNMSFALYIFISFFLGFATGRVQLPLSIIFPIYMVQFGFDVLPIFDFLILYSAIFMGYVCTPVHPCISLSIEYFKTDYKNGAKLLLKPTLIMMIVIYLAYGIKVLIG